jgi:hypothetical protein
VRWSALLVVLAAIACGTAPEPVSQSAEKAVTRVLGSWSGKGSTTLGFVSESGSFRITWKAHNEDNARPGAFQLTLRSGISGRPMKVIADHKGAGSGSVEFGDDPRMYEFLVESRGVEWSIAVEETFAPKRQP